MNKKKVFLAVLALILVCSLSVAGTLAFLTFEQNGENAVVNTFVAAGGGEIINPIDPPEAPDVDPDPDDEDEIELQDGFFLVEHKADYDKASASYTLLDNYVITNTYDKVVPGMTIDKDPMLTADINTDVDAYVFIKVIDSTKAEKADTANLSYYIDNTVWQALPGRSDVYVYTENGTAIINGTDKTELDYVPLFKDLDDAEDKTLYAVKAADTLTDTVADDESKPATLGIQLGELKFEAYACQAGGFSDAATAFATCFPNA